MVNQIFEEKYNQLNPEQKLAVDTVYGPVLVVAGPGSGKTQLLSLRVANILKLTDSVANSILCLTFTDSAATNMKTRLAKIIGPEAYKVAIHTFHSFATEIIAQNQEYFFFGASFKPADQLDQVQILRAAFESLDSKNPLRAYHSEQDFVFLNDAVGVIQALKKGGLSPAEFRDLLDHNKKFLENSDSELKKVFSERVNAKTVENLWIFMDLVETLTESDNSNRLNISSNLPGHSWDENYQTMSEYVLMQLVQAKNMTQLNTEKTSTTYVTSWKNKFTTKDTQNEVHFKDFLKLDKWYTLADLYQKYQDNLHSQGLFDFADMLLEVAKAFEDPARIDLKYNLQEKFQFVLVDEFQDTNGVQMRLLENLIDNELNEGQPNLLLVGDDDQAVFKFQGANIQNMLKFKENYPATQIIKLTKNYRSTQDILDLAMSVIEQSSERLDLGGQKKVIVAARSQ